jgi:O-antigen/teichoic acid export membrane protein
MPALARAAVETNGRVQTASRSLRRFSKNRLAISVVALAASGSTTLLFNVFVARAIGPIGFGGVARTFAVAMAAAQIPMAGITPAVARHIAALREGEQLPAARGAWRFGFVGGACAALVFLVCAEVGLCPSDPVLLIGGASLAAVYPVYFNLKISLFAVGAIAEYAVLELTADLVFISLLAATVTSGHPRAALSVFAVAYGLFCVVGARRLAIRAPLTTRIEVDRGFARFSLLSFVSTYASVGRFPLLVVIAGAAGGAVAAGHVAPALAIATPLLLVPQAAGLLAFVDSAAHPRGDADEKIRRLARIVALVGLLGVVLVIAGGSWFARLLLGPQFKGPELMIIGAGLLPLVLGTTSANALAGRGKIGKTTTISTASLAAGVAITWAATSRYGATGAAAGIAAASALTGIGNLRAAGRALGGATWMTAALAAAVGIVGASTLGASGLGRLLCLLGLIPLAFAVVRRPSARLST